MTADKHISAISRQRRVGILLHPTSLPGELGNGDFGHQAYRFIEFLNKHGFKVWQMLPLGPTHDDGSPYQCLSTHAGNPLLISLEWLEDKGWLDRDKIDDNQQGYRCACLQQAARFFYQLNDDAWSGKLEEFKKQHACWLDDYALFIALKQQQHNRPWYDWPDDLRHREKKALAAAGQSLQAVIQQTVFEQFVFFTQWHEIRAYAKQHEVELFGDMPIFVARDSADVWAQRKNFLMDEDGAMPFVAGVPPDAFSDTGQRWGNPLYNWERMEADGFDWWKQRFKTQLELFDLIRIDHFRGLQACWQIPQDDETAINGRWVETPGRKILNELFKAFHHLPLVAEDLGVITDEVIELKKMFDLPGMKVLQFAFDGNSTNPHLPHCHEPGDVIYTGTHDNDTTLGWAGNEASYNKAYFEEYTGSNIESVESAVWSMIRLAMSSVSFLCVLPMQDLLMLDSSARMNTPGTTEYNWQWRFDWQQVKPEIIIKIARLVTLYQR
ncbi:MAG: 4-alpha-glucanotransferase [Gammaproteobacteria bacterium]|nr:4-alpha-glucanotransferase [Gammaproteobacteria bacterium]